jgi:hypothetical protein
MKGIFVKHLSYGSSNKQDPGSHKFGDDRDVETVMTGRLITRDMEFYQTGLNFTDVAQTVFKTTGIAALLNPNCACQIFSNLYHLHCTRIF